MSNRRQMMTMEEIATSRLVTEARSPNRPQLSGSRLLNRKRPPPDRQPPLDRQPPPDRRPPLDHQPPPGRRPPLDRQPPLDRPPPPGVQSRSSAVENRCSASTRCHRHDFRSQFRSRRHRSTGMTAGSCPTSGCPDRLRRCTTRRRPRTTCRKKKSEPPPTPNSNELKAL